LSIDGVIAFVGRRGTAHACSNADATALTVLVREIEPGVGDRPRSRDERKLTHAVQQPQTSWRKMRVAVEVDRSSDRRQEPRCKRRLEPFDARASRRQILEQVVR
jgi:hypothetical protein